jgi:HK97 family phage major capsid protein
MGRPVIATQACPVVGDKGDIILADLSKYLTVQKVGGIRSETSIHLWFDYDMTAFRFILRVAGQPWWNAYITPASGTAYLGAFVTIDDRA